MPNPRSALDAQMALSLFIRRPWLGASESGRSAIVKKHLITLSLSLAATTTFTQGLVNFANTPTTLVSISPLVYPPKPASIMSGPPGSYYFGLFLLNSKNYTFTGIYATNTGINGLFSGGTVAVPGWAPGTSQEYFVAGWSAAFMGHDFRPIWLTGSQILGNFGMSPGAFGIAGNASSIPTLNLFEGSGIPFGFELYNNLVPEPATAVLAMLGAATVAILRRSGTLKSRAFK
jgi:hypothetical protein